jgi:hypothetical protein
MVLCRKRTCDLKPFSTSRGLNPNPKDTFEAMKTNPILHAVVLATTLLVTGAAAQTPSPTPPADATPLVGPMPTPNQIIYIPQLPNPAELANAAVAQGISVEQINQTSAQITVVYKYANGQTNTICYQLLSAAGAAPAMAAPAVATPVTTVVPSATTVIYTTPAPSYYYYDPYRYSWPWFAPISIGLGFDIGHGFRGGYGGFRGGYGGFRGRGFNGGFHGHGR